MRARVVVEVEEEEEGYEVYREGQGTIG